MSVYFFSFSIISSTKKVRMIINFKNFIIKSLLFIISSLLSLTAKEVNTQQLMFPKYEYTINLLIKQYLSYKNVNKFMKNT